NSSGIGISNDGGGTFTTAMTGGGVVADVVTSGTFRGLNFEGGYLYSQNNNTEWDLNSGELKMENADLTLKSGALINFTSRGKRLKLYNSDRYSGLGVGLGIDHNYPLTYVGVSENTNKLDAEDNSYRGLITQSKTAISKGFPHTLIGEDVWFRKD